MQSAYDRKMQPACRLHTNVCRSLKIARIITCSTIVLQCYKATSRSYGARRNSTLRNFVLLGPIVTKLGMVDNVADPYSDTNFSEIWLSGEFPANR